MPIWCIHEAEKENYALGHIQKRVQLAVLFKTSQNRFKMQLVVVKIIILDQYFLLSLRFDTHTLNKLTFCILLITQYIVYILTCTTWYFSISDAEFIQGQNLSETIQGQCLFQIICLNCMYMYGTSNFAQFIAVT